jgi:hypothetical protein
MIIDFLSTQTEALEDDRQYFTVNTAVTEVYLDSLNPCLDQGRLRSAKQSALPFSDLSGRGLRYFQPGDNLIILSGGAILPHGFSCGTKQFRGEIFVTDNASVIHNIPGVSNDGAIHLPFENYELSINAFYKCLSKMSLAFVLNTIDAGTLNYNAGTVSMVNCPSAFTTGNKLPVTAFLKVQHSLPMIA